MAEAAQILVVDDEDAARLATVRVLRQAGHEVREAADGNAALAAVQQSPPHLVLLDMHLPDMLGTEVLRRIRASPWGPSVAVVLLSARLTGSQHQADGLEAGADGYIARPVSNQELLARVRLHLRLRANTESLRASEARFRLLSKASHEAIWDCDLVTGVVWWNDTFTELTGRPYVAGQSGYRVRQAHVHPQDAARVEQRIRDAIKGDVASWSASYRFRRGDGSYAQVADRGHIIRNAQGRAVRMVGALIDVSDTLRLEEQLRQSQRLESVGQLTGGLAHDFNNLLTVIVGNADLLREQLAGRPDDQALAEMIHGAAQRGADLTQRLLAFARKQPLDPRPVDIRRLVAGFEALLRRSLGEQVEIELVHGAELWPALVDPAQLENCLLNLCLNARDAMPRGGRLTIATANADVDQDFADRHPGLAVGQYLVLEVSDTGFGIAHEHLPRVFEPFFTTKAKGRGTGLGLAMVHGFVLQSGGQVTVVSEPGRGTTVRLYLPRAAGEETSAAPDQPSAPAQGKGERILLLEDDPLVRQHVAGQLAMLGYVVLEAEGGEQALEILRSAQPVDLLFTDVVMPGMGGPEVAERAGVLRPGLRVLYTSGYTENAIVHDGRLDPGVLLLGKPYRRQELARKIRQALEQEAPGGSPPPSP